MMSKDLKATLSGIVEGYFEGKDLTELIQSAGDKIMIDRFETQLLNFKG